MIKIERQEYLNMFNLKVNINNLYSIPFKTKFEAQDKEGFKYFISFSNLANLKKKIKQGKDSKLAKYYNGNIYTFDNINLFLSKNKSNLTLIKMGGKAIEKSIFHCNIHDQDFAMAWNSIKNGQGCPKCGQESKIKSKTHSIEWIKQEALRRFNIKIISEFYTSNTDRLKFVCQKHKGEVQEKSWGQMLESSHPCKYCSKDILVEKYKEIPHNTVIKKTQKQFLQELQQISGDRYTPLEEYKGITTKIKIKCNNCNKIFSMQPNHLLEGHGCVCNKSLGENRIRLFLEKHNIKFVPQKVFEDCQDKRKLSYDFYLPNLHTLIEYQGIQHYQPTKRFGGNDSFDIQQKHDKIKKNYAINHNYNFIEICYKDYEKIESILADMFNIYNDTSEDERQYADIDKLKDVF